MKPQNFNQPIILECDFCKTTEHFTDNKAAIDADWNWMDSQYNDGTKVETVACPDCPTDKVNERHDEKMEMLTYSEESKSSEKAKRDPAQASL